MSFENVPVAYTIVYTRTKVTTVTLYARCLLFVVSRYSLRQKLPTDLIRIGTVERSFWFLADWDIINDGICTQDDFIERGAGSKICREVWRRIHYRS